MVLKNIEQPNYLKVDDNIRLRKFDNKFYFALDWYKDLDIVWLVDGDTKPYDMELLEKMYNYWSNVGECYFIEILENDKYIPIGDVILCENDLPIVIGNKNYQRKGIGKKVIKTLINRARELNFKEIIIEEIYTWNVASQNMFLKLGFKKYKKQKQGYSYKLIL